MSQPFMQLWVADYLGDTRHLSTTQHGAYLLLLMCMWRADGDLPNDDGQLARMAGLTVRGWLNIKDGVMALFTVADSRVTQKRLAAELLKCKSKTEKRMCAGKAGGEAKALKDKELALANAMRLPCHSSEPEPERRKKKKEPPADAGALVVFPASSASDAVPVLVALHTSEPVLPDWVDREAWNGFCEMRKRKRLPMTDRAKSLILKKLEAFRAQGHDPAAILDASTASSWTDVYEPKEQKIYGNRKPTSHDKFLAAAEGLIRDTLEGSGKQDNDPLEQAGYPLLSS